MRVYTLFFSKMKIKLIKKLFYIYKNKNLFKKKTFFISFFKRIYISQN